VEENHHKIFLKHVGDNIRKIRTDKGLSMVKLANEANIEYRQLGRIERGEINTSLISVLKIANALNVDVSEFVRQTAKRQ
jgi:transcriptional regulator with XRE-family HTH domain